MLLEIFLPLSLAFIMFSLGIGLTLGDFARVAQEPKGFAVGAIAQVVLLPVVAFALLHVINLPPELAVGVMILSLCPGGVTSNMLTKLAGGNLALSISLTGVISLLSIITAPLVVVFSANYFMGLAAPDINVTSLAIAMFLITALPVAIGVALRHFATGFAQGAERIVTIIATVLFVVIVIGALATNWTLFIDNLASLGPVLILLNILMLALGFGLARMASLAARDGTAIAIEAGVQNATLGIAIGGIIAASGEALSVFALPSGVYGITMYLVVLPFILWRRRA
ncbi:MAG: bile acid:sodium symporter family protein [Pikeienuella sp.]